MGPGLHWLYVTTFLDLLATSLVVPFFPMHLRSYELSTLVVGVITSVYPSMQLFSSPAVGFYSERYGHKSTLLASLLVSSLAYYLLAATSSISAIIICRVVLGLVKHTQTICKAAFLSYNDKFARTVGFGGLSSAEALGFMLGPVIGALIIGKENGFQHLCTMTATIFLINSFIAFLVLPVEKQLVSCKSKSENVMKVFDETHFVCFTLFWDILLLKLILCLSLSLFYVNYHLIILEYLKMPYSMVGYTNSFQGLICIVSGYFSSRISDYFQSHYFKLSFWFLIMSCCFFFIDIFPCAATFIIILVPLSCSSSLLRIYLAEALLSLPSFSNKASIIGVENAVATIASLSSPFVLESFSYASSTMAVTYLPFLISGSGSILSLILYLKKETISFSQYKINL